MTPDTATLSATGRMGVRGGGGDKKDNLGPAFIASSCVWSFLRVDSDFLTRGFLSSFISKSLYYVSMDNITLVSTLSSVKFNWTNVS